jgi:glycosyltransferase involved in cell wall biosynthesis
VDWQSFAASNQDEGFYLLVTALVPYKRVDLAIEAANRMKFPLKIIGTGQDEKCLSQLAGPSVELLGWQSILRSDSTMLVARLSSFLAKRILVSFRSRLWHAENRS